MAVFLEGLAEAELLPVSNTVSSGIAQLERIQDAGVFQTGRFIIQIDGVGQAFCYFQVFPNVACVVEWVEEDYEDKKHHSLDLTGYYQLSSDTIPIISDSSYWKNKRDIPLTQEEETKYEKTSIRTTQANGFVFE